MDMVSEWKGLVIKGKRSLIGEGMKQCSIALKDEGKNDGEFCSFVTTGDSWSMIRYDGKAFSVTQDGYLIEGMETRRSCG